MFTGLVEELGRVERIDRAASGQSVRITIHGPLVSEDAKLGDSIAVNGCCLTVVERSGSLLAFDAGSETLSRTNLGQLQPSSQVNLERSLRVGERLGGHLVLGHIDGTGTLHSRRDEGAWSHFTFRVAAKLSRQMASKGSVAVDGVSLTLVDVDDESFSVALIPHTLANTTLGQLGVGQLVNIETDVLAKYVERQLAVGLPKVPGCLGTSEIGDC